MQEPLREDFTRIPTISSYQNLSKLMQGPLRGSHQDFDKIFLRQDLHKIMQEPLREDFTRISQYLRIRTCRSSCRDLLEDVSRIFTRSSHKDMYKITQGPLTGLHQDLRNIFSQGPSDSRFCEPSDAPTKHIAKLPWPRNN